MKHWLSTVAMAAALLALPHPMRGQGTPMGSEFRVNTYTTESQSGPRVASGASGSFLVVWTSGQNGSPATGPNNDVLGQRYAGSGAPLGLEFQVNTFTAGGQSNAAVASDSAGDFVVVWQSAGQDGGIYGVFGQRYSSSGAAVGSEFLVNTYTTSYQFLPDVASDPSGNFVVVWTSNGQDGSAGGIFGQRYTSSGAPAGSEFRVNSYTTLTQYQPRVSSDSSGNFVVVWTSGGPDGSYGPTSYGVSGQRYSSSGTPLGTEFQVNTYTTGVQAQPDVSVAPSGSFVVVWASPDGSNYGVFGQRYASSGAPLGGEFRVNSYTTYKQTIPAVASDSAGNFVVTWVSDREDGSAFGIFGQRYTSSGAPLGLEFQVNTYTTNDQNQPAVSSDAAGEFVIVWHSRGEDGDLFGVFGQRYGKIVPVELTRFTAE